MSHLHEWYEAHAPSDAKIIHNIFDELPEVLPLYSDEFPVAREHTCPQASILPCHVRRQGCLKRKSTVLASTVANHTLPLLPSACQPDFL
jgi:hypothetical protein